MKRNSFTVEVRGFNQVIQALQDAADAPSSERVEIALAEVGAQIIDTAKSLVPVLSGDLRDNLHVGGFTHLTPGYRPIGPYNAYKRLPHPAGKPRAVILGSKLPYAHLVESGGKHNAAHPFLRPAIDQHRKDIAKAVDLAIDKAIDK